jgi:hypothetical protein
MISLLLIAGTFLAVDEPAPAATSTPEPASSIAPDVQEIVLYDHDLIAPRERARQACAYNEEGRTWACDAQLLAHWQMKRRDVATAPSGVKLIGGPYPKDATAVDECFATGMAVGFADPTEDIVIEWDTAALIVDGVAAPAVPGFARQMTAGLSQRTVRVPKGAKYVETLFPVSTSTCIFPPPQSGAPTTTTAQVQIDRGGSRETISVSVTRQWVPGSEHDAFTLIDRPWVAQPPSSTPSEPGTMTWMLAGSGIGPGAGLVIGGAAGAGLGFFGASVPENAATVSEFGGKAGTVGVFAAYFGIPLGLLGAIVGGVAGHVGGDADAAKSYADAMRYWRWREKRIALGLSAD